MSSRGAPLPPPKSKDYTRDNDIRFLERSHERTKNKLESEVVTLAKNWHNRVVNFEANPNSGLHGDLLQSSYYALSDAVVALISFEKSI